MGVREELKQQTREKIIEHTTQLIYENGFNKISTKDISIRSGVSHGTIFLHFDTKSNLLNTILSSNVVELQNALTERCLPTLEPDVFIGELLQTLIQFENILSRVYKDYSYLDDDLQKQIDDIETVIKKLFFDCLNQDRSTTFNIIDAFILIDAFMSQIIVNLLDKTVYSKTNSILRQRRGKIMKLYRMLFDHD